APTALRTVSKTLGRSSSKSREELNSRPIEYCSRSRSSSARTSSAAIDGALAPSAIDDVEAGAPGECQDRARETGVPDRPHEPIRHAARATPGVSLVELDSLHWGDALFELLRRELQRLGVLPGGLTDHLPLLRGQLDADRLLTCHDASSRKGALS